MWAYNSYNTPIRVYIRYEVLEANAQLLMSSINSFFLLLLLSSLPLNVGVADGSFRLVK